MATSSDDDMPLARSNGHVSASKISRAEDKAMDATDSKIKPAPAGISIVMMTSHWQNAKRPRRKRNRSPIPTMTCPS
ncbi:hypothetical protein HYQ46_000160 [Verticillium longisporum]|nr:hypothetical protein HYQ46_000160 [Verticillium longisporum]